MARRGLYSRCLQLVNLELASVSTNNHPPAHQPVVLTRFHHHTHGGDHNSQSGPGQQISCTCRVCLFGLAYVQGHVPYYDPWDKAAEPMLKPSQGAMPEQEDTPQQRAASSANVPRVAFPSPRHYWGSPCPAMRRRSVISDLTLELKSETVDGY